MEWILLSHLNSLFLPILPPVIHTLLQSNVLFLMETFSPVDIKEELREFEERCVGFFFQGFLSQKRKQKQKT